MKSGVTERGRKTREKILQTAANLFHQRGVAGTSIDEILCACETGKSQFYHYFKSKDELLCQVARFHLEQVRKILPQLNTWKGMQSWFDQLIGWMEATDCAGG